MTLLGASADPVTQGPTLGVSDGEAPSSGFLGGDRSAVARAEVRA